jgi:hypothetical protein
MLCTVASTFFLCIPLILYWTYPSTKIQHGLATLLILNIILSLLFWSNPIQHSFIHTIDAIFAKISYVCFTVYILCNDMPLPFKLLFVSILLLSALLFYYSHVHSVEWGSPEHVMFHSMFHGMTSAGCSLAFLNVHEYYV